MDEQDTHHVRIYASHVFVLKPYIFRHSTTHLLAMQIFRTSE
jgi:hypothetical protein